METSSIDTEYAQRHLATASTKRQRATVLITLAERSRTTSPEQAIAFASEALKLVDGIDDYLSACCTKAIGFARIAVADHVGARGALKSALRLFERSGDKTEQAAMAMALAAADATTEAYRDAVEHYQQAARLYEESNDRMAVIAALRSLATLYTSLGNYAKALEYYLHCREIADAVGDPISIGDALRDVAILYGTLEEYDQALEMFTKAREKYRQAGNRLLEVEATVNIASMLNARGDSAEALSDALSAMTVYEMLGLQRELSTILLLIGSIHEAMGQLETALGYALHALDIVDQIGEEGELAPVLLNIGRLYYSTGRYSDALYVLDQALYTVRNTNDLHLKVSIHHLISITAKKLGDTARALCHHEQYVELNERNRSHEMQRTIAELQLRYDLAQMEKEREFYRLKSEHLESEAKLRSQELAMIAIHLIERSELINDVRVALQRIADQSGSDTGVMIIRLLKDLKTRAHDRDDWNSFEQQFTQIFPEFLRDLAHRYPDLTPMERKVCALTKMELSTSEIAKLLNVGTRNIETHRYRLRKKLDIASSDNLSTFLAAL